jgi:hypothetical protein
MSADWMAEFTVMNMVLGTGIIWLSGMFVWLLKRFTKSYDENTRTLVEINKTMQVMDRKLDTATQVDREILVELSRPVNCTYAKR